MSGSKAMSCGWPLRNIAAVSRTFLLAQSVFKLVPGTELKVLLDPPPTCALVL